MKKIAVLLITGAIFLSACSPSKWVRTTVVKQKDLLVTLEQREEEGQIIQQQYGHPFEIDLEDLKKLMSDLTYSEQAGFIGKAKKNAVFQAVEIERLAPVLKDTLAKADASQRIRFTSFNQGKSFIFSISRETEGVLFIDPEKRLNIAFNFINSDIDMDETPTYPPSFSKVEPLKTRTSATIIIPPAPYAELHQFDTGEAAPMWVVADLEKLKEAAVTMPASVSEKKTETAPAAETPTAQPVSKDQLEKEIKNRLKYLKELLDEGLISEKDYNAEKAELLDKLD